MPHRWIITDQPDLLDDAVRRWSLPKLVAQLLLNRGIGLADDVLAHLDPRLDLIHDPSLLPGAEAAARILADAVRKQRRIVIYGDYDVDGITGVAILWSVLKRAGVDAGYYVPHRIDEGYGLNLEAIRTLAADGANVVVSVDCGITAVDVAEEARRLGLTLIITDHHQPDSKLPQSDALVHPTIGEGYPNPGLCGSGVAFKLAWALARELSGSDRVNSEFREALTEALPLVALATIADVVPLTGENRVLTVHGLRNIQQSRCVGLRELLRASGLDNGRVSGTDVGFKIAPRLNAAGRLGHARLAVDLLTRADHQRAAEIALYLEDHNRKRQTMERKIFQEACRAVEQFGMDKDSCRGIALASAGWHAGVIGIVASRIVDKYRRPTVMVSLDNGVAQGSIRGVEHFHVHEALTACAEHLTSYGGHAAAGGIRLQPDCFEAFRDAFIEQANARLSPVDLSPRLRLDAEVSLLDLDMHTVEAIQKLGPFGPGNHKPRLATGWLELADEPRCVGNGGGHVAATFREGSSVMRSIAFGLSEHIDLLRSRRRCRLAMEPMINDFNGRRTVEMRVLDYRFEDE